MRGDLGALGGEAFGLVPGHRRRQRRRRRSRRHRLHRPPHLGARQALEAADLGFGQRAIGGLPRAIAREGVAGSAKRRRHHLPPQRLAPVDEGRRQAEHGRRAVPAQDRPRGLGAIAIAVVESEGEMRLRVAPPRGALALRPGRDAVAPCRLVHQAIEIAGRNRLRKARLVAAADAVKGEDRDLPLRGAPAAKPREHARRVEPARQPRLEAPQRGPRLSHRRPARASGRGSEPIRDRRRRR